MASEATQTQSINSRPFPDLSSQSQTGIIKWIEYLIPLEGCCQLWTAKEKEKPSS